jgi:hypothetical protein
MKEGRGMGSREEKEKGRLIEAFGGMVDELREWRAQHADASFDRDSSPSDATTAGADG